MAKSKRIISDMTLKQEKQENNTKLPDLSILLNACNFDEEIVVNVDLQ